MKMIDQALLSTKLPNRITGEEQKKQINPDKTLIQSFEKIFEKTDQNLKLADQAVLKANTGESVNLHELMIAMEKADISLRLMVQVRNKAIDAYHEIMRMQV
jgi:flagellar hook-basal body complex protein FliE